MQKAIYELSENKAAFLKEILSVAKVKDETRKIFKIKKWLFNSFNDKYVSIKFQGRLSNFLPSHGPSCYTDLLDYFLTTAECGVGVLWTIKTFIFLSLLKAFLSSLFSQSIL